MKLSQSMQSFELTKDWCNELEGICFEELTDQRAERQLGQLQMKLEGIRDSIVNYRHILQIVHYFSIFRHLVTDFL